MVLEADIGGVETERAGNKRGVGGRARLDRQLGEAEPGMARLGGVDRHGAGHRPDRLLEPEEIGALGAAMVERGEEDGGADRRVSGKGHLEPGREDAQAGPMLGVLRAAGRTPSPRG